MADYPINKGNQHLRSILTATTCISWTNLTLPVVVLLIIETITCYIII